jgi:hypothetical protein
MAWVIPRVAAKVVKKEAEERKRRSRRVSVKCFR